jgi:hypothetical protein
MAEDFLGAFAGNSSWICHRSASEREQQGSGSPGCLFAGFSGSIWVPFVVSWQSLISSVCPTGLFCLHVCWSNEIGNDRMEGTLPMPLHSACLTASPEARKHLFRTDAFLPGYPGNQALFPFRFVNTIRQRHLLARNILPKNPSR